MVMTVSRTSWSRERSRSSARRSSTAQRSRRSTSPSPNSGAQRPRLGHALAVIARRLRHDRDLRRREPRQAAVEDQIARVLVMVVVVDRHPDVVQHARRPQQLALPVVALVQAQRGELVEHPQCQRRHVAGVVCVHVVARRQVQHRGASHVLEQRRAAIALRAPASAVGEMALEEDPLAQPCLGDLQLLEAPGLQRAPTTTAPGQDQVGARRLDPRHAARSAAGSAASRCTSSSSAASVTVAPWTPLVGIPAARWAATARLRTVPPIPTSRRPVARQPGRATELAGDVLAAAPPAACASPGRGPGESARSSAPPPAATSPTRAPAGRRTRTSCIEPPPRSSTQPSPSVVELTAAR